MLCEEQKATRARVAWKVLRAVLSVRLRGHDTSGGSSGYLLAGRPEY